MNSIESTDSMKRAVYWFLVIFIFKTRMHSSRMRTTRYSGHPRGVMDLPGGGLLRRGVCAGGCLPRWGYLPIWGYLPRGFAQESVCPRGVCPGEGVCLEGDVCPGGGCLPRKGVSAQEGGVCPGGLPHSP